MPDSTDPDPNEDATNPDPNEDAINQGAITSIAQEMHYPLPVVKRVYQTEFEHLKASARITDYLVLFAVRRTRDALLARHT